MSTGVVIMWIVAAILGSSVLAAVVTGVFSKRRMSAEATDIMTKAATNVVELLKDQNRRQLEDHERELAKRERRHERELAQNRRRVEEVEGALQAEILVRNQKERDWHETLQLHASWDHIAITKVREAGIDIPDAPPLHPPGHRPNRV